MRSLKILGFAIGILLMASIFFFIAGIIRNEAWMMGVAGVGVFVSGILIVIALRKLNVALGVIQNEVEGRIRRHLDKVEAEGAESKASKTKGSEPKQG